MQATTTNVTMIKYTEMQKRLRGRIVSSPCVRPSFCSSVSLPHGYPVLQFWNVVIFRSWVTSVHRATDGRQCTMRRHNVKQCCVIGTYCGYQRRCDREQGGNCPPPNFGLSENCREILFLSEKFRSKCKNRGLKPLILWKFRGKIEILSTHNDTMSSVGHLQMYVEKKSQLPAPPTFLTDATPLCGTLNRLCASFAQQACDVDTG